MTSRKKFIKSVGATCKNWNWSWSFVNHDQRFVIFGLWDVHKDGLIFDTEWRGPGRSQSLEHIRLVEEEGYKLKTFPMQYSEKSDGTAKIKSFDPVLEEKFLVGVSGCWYALGDEDEAGVSLAEEVFDPEKYIEGATRKISVNSYERNPKARKKCLDYYGYKCFVCNFDFEDFYGKIGRNFIHVHHEVALSEIKEEYEVDPIKDLKPLCPNCHAIIHRTMPPVEVSKLVAVLNSKRTGEL